MDGLEELESELGADVLESDGTDVEGLGGEVDDVQLDEDGNPIELDEHGNPVEFDEDGNPVELDEDGNPVEAAPEAGSAGWQKRVNKLTARAKAAEELLAERDATIAELNGKLGDETRQIALGNGILPDLLTPEERTLIKEESELRKDREWLLLNMNEDYTGQDGTVHSADELRQRFVKIDADYLRVFQRANTVRDRALAETRKRMTAPTRERRTTKTPATAPALPTKGNAGVRRTPVSVRKQGRSTTMDGDAVLKRMGEASTADGRRDALADALAS